MWSVSLYILIDELELSFKQTKKYQRDITLIRDLIFAVQYICEISKQHYYNVYIISAIRNEVYKNIISKGMEINKTVHDFGVTIEWQQKGGDKRKHPLLRMLEKRIRFSEEIKGLSPTKDVWNEYFIPFVGEGKVAVQNYILDLTWYKPRDIIRLFSIIQFMQGNKNIIDQETFDTVRKRYSEESWTEFEEVLTSKYLDKEVEGIKQALTELRLPFETKDFIAQIEGKADTYEEVEFVKNGNKKPAQILRDLYDIGVIGNYGSQPRFKFKGDDGIDPLIPLTFHYPLIRFFKASIDYEKVKHNKKY